MPSLVRIVGSRSFLQRNVSSTAPGKGHSTLLRTLENDTPRKAMNTAHFQIVDQLRSDRTAFHLGGERVWNSLPETLRDICTSVEPHQVTLETGVGASTVVFAACGACHTAISPDADEHHRVAEYCEQIGIDTSRLTFVEGLSHDVLPSLLTRERTLDAAFIDGAHSFPFPEVDWFYITRSLKVGGRLLMDDVPIPAVTPLFRHMQLERNWRLEGILDDRAAAFTLLAAPEPEDWTKQLFNAEYPDYTFVDLPARIKLTTRYRVSRLRSGIAERYPLVQKAYQGVLSGIATRTAR